MLKSTLLQAVKEAGGIMQKSFHGHFKISNKAGVNNLVTEVDHASEKAIVNTIKQNFPAHSVLSEEMGKIETNSDYKWIVDPIDGTVNYANGIPICCVSIAVEYQGAIVLGAVFNPFFNELFVAEKGKGATLNDEPIHVSDKNDLSSACLVTGFPYSILDKPNGPLEIFNTLIRRGIPLRRLGSAAIDLCWVAAGRFDGFYEHKLEAWDSAAGFLIVEEAGGKVTDFKGTRYSPYQPELLATNGSIHSALQECINGGKK